MTPEEKRRHDAWVQEVQEATLHDLCDELGYGHVIELVVKWIAGGESDGS